MKEEIRILIEEERLTARVRELAEKINEDYAGKKIHLVCILKGSVFFACELAKNIKVPLTMDFMTVSSYGDSTTSSGTITIEQDLSMDVANREILIVEDIVDSGRTLSYLVNVLKKRNPASLSIVTLLDKPSCRVTSVETAYCGFEIEDRFVVGYGLDYAQKYRNLPYIGELIVKEEVPDERI
jgi:hypoxanthine phosphoribosyltransferase